jgi:secernin
MCDTVAAARNSTAQRIMLFGKNSDRERNEAQALDYVPGADHSADTLVGCTYISIPQVRRTHAVLISRPFWMWGAEMGANEHGVVIGNEGLHARSPAPEAPALTGMDLLRLALERATSAAEALEVITTLLQRHGQGGNCGHLLPSYYNNGFLIADAREAFVLETVGREWLSERVLGVRTLSNIYSIDECAEHVSGGLHALIRGSGWGDADPPRYADAISNPHREHIGYAKARRARSAALLSAHAGGLRAEHLMSALRDHGPAASAKAAWHPRSAPTVSVCMHAGTEERPGQTVASMVSEIDEQEAVHWVTGTAAPCISIYKPLLMDTPPPAAPCPTDRFDERTLWWKHERLHRAVVTRDFGRFVDEIQQERDALEARFCTRIHAVREGGTREERSRAVAECWREAGELTQRWEARVARMPVERDGLYRSTWAGLDQLAGLRAASGDQHE